eukprot:GEMP01085538.1.p1 GENE.GEMP01085538.1~~GEMP01085538.1.p1  ORF type:complete len:146 (+),score=22.81 GEMP01085538.1:54-440(+)
MTTADEVFFLEDPSGKILTICGANTIAPPPEHPRLTCHNCQTLLEYAEIASYVQCYVCNTMNAVLRGNETMGGRTINMLCTICSTSNLAPWGTHYVRCGSCATVSDVSHVYSLQSPQDAGQRGAGNVG